MMHGQKNIKLLFKSSDFYTTLRKPGLSHVVRMYFPSFLFQSYYFTF